MRGLKEAVFFVGMMVGVKSEVKSTEGAMVSH